MISMSLTDRLIEELSIYFKGSRVIEGFDIRYNVISPDLELRVMYKDLGKGKAYQNILLDSASLQANAVNGNLIKNIKEMVLTTAIKFEKELDFNDDLKELLA